MSGAASSTWTVALDLEGTLISSAVSQWPRPGLRVFLDGLGALGVRVVLFTSVSEPRARQILRTLADEGSVPVWAVSIPYVAWDGPSKDLRLAHPAADLETVLLVDDMPVVPHGQETRRIPVAPFEAPFDDGSDAELLRVLMVIRERCLPAGCPRSSDSNH